MTALGVDFTSSVCTDSIGGQSALAQFHDAGPTGMDKKVFRIAADPPDHWSWAVPVQSAALVPSGLVQFATDDRIVSLGKGGVFALKPPSSQWETLEQPSSSLYGSGAGDLAVWVESDSTRIRGWTPVGGVKTIIPDAPAKTCTVAVSDDQIVGAATDACLGASNGVRFWSLGRSGAEPPLRTSPKIGGPAYLASPSGLRTWGRYAALQVWNQGPDGTASTPPYLIVADLSSWKAWKIASVEPYFMEESMWTLDDTYLYWGENKDPQTEALHVRHVARVRLGSLDAAGTRI
jgi:hypothetical protein